jgi:signal transduction histidine kinase
MIPVSRRSGPLRQKIQVFRGLRAVIGPVSLDHGAPADEEDWRDAAVRPDLSEGFALPPDHPQYNLAAPSSAPPPANERYLRGMERLISAVRDLSLARDLHSVRDIVRHAARELTGADGATFILRDQDKCYYVDEDAIGPLWKGRRFPMSSCISGWAMTHKEAVVVDEIYADERIPHAAYRPTFVRSLAMVPIRTANPIGAIGNYWANNHRATNEEVKLLQALADSTSVALENVQIYAELDQRVRDRTAQLEAANKELDAFCHSVSHDLRAPLRAIRGFSAQLMAGHAEQLSAEGRAHLQRVSTAADRMSGLIDDLLNLSHITSADLRRERVNLSGMAHDVVETIRSADTQRCVEVTIAPDVEAYADRKLLRIVLENLLSNAWKFTRRRADAKIEFGLMPGSPGTFLVKDNGAGFDMEQARRLFGAFQRLHSAEDFEGTGVGLATVRRIILKHGGNIWAESAVDQGATFYFTLPGSDL